MKITKTQLAQIIKEELEAVVETARFEGGPEVDIQDAIQMLEAEEDTTGTLFMVINRLHEALAKLAPPPQIAEGGVAAAIDEREELEAEAREVGIPEEDIGHMPDDQLIAAIHAALDNAPQRVY